MRNHFTFQELGLENTAKLRGLLAITTGFLWLRVLSLLKAINMQLATFVLAILQIMKDIIWFCVNGRRTFLRSVLRRESLAENQN